MELRREERFPRGSFSRYLYRVVYARLEFPSRVLETLLHSEYRFLNWNCLEHTDD
jgi:hypothetical protein